MNRDIQFGHQIINDCIKKLYQTSTQSISMVDKEEIYELCIHDIQDCLYWIKHERDMKGIE